MSIISRIGVVGGGASAVCLLDALARADGPPPGELTVFEPSPQLWRGRPYRADLDAIRVNAVPGDMSVRGHDFGHLRDWLQARTLISGTAYRDPISGGEFVPRAVYGDYLEQSARSALRALVGRGWVVRTVREPVVAAEPTADALVLRTGSGLRFTVDHVVLCFGAGKPADAYSLEGSPGFIAEPYPTVHALAGIDPDADVAVLGSGLTAIDVVLALDVLGHRGRVRMLSRRGVLPGVRQRPVGYRLKHFTPARFRAIAAAGGRLTMAEVVAAIRDELAAAGEAIGVIEREIAAIEGEDPVARLRRNLAEVDSPSLALRILQQAVPDAGPDVWPLLSEREQAHILSTHDRTLMSLCCPMPASNAAALLRLIDMGRVELVRGVTDVRAVDGGFAVRGDVEFTAPVVVNATNARARRVSEKAGGLVGSLVRAGLVQPHHRGGVQVERATSRCTVDGVPDARVHALGDPALGSLFFTFGVQSLVDRAVDIAAAIAERWTAPALARADQGERDDDLQFV